MFAIHNHKLEMYLKIFVASKTKCIFDRERIYIETNDEARNNLYKSKNGVYVPLNVLENEGLIDFQDIKITDKDYVITMLGSEDETGACIDTTTIGSWDDGNKTIYLCATASGTSNIQVVGGQADNISKIERTRKYYYKYEETLRNYVTYNDNGPYRILYVDTDDSLVLVSENSFGSVFNNLSMYISYKTTSADTNYTCYNGSPFYCKNSWNSKDPILNKSLTQQLIDCDDMHYMYKLTDDRDHWLEKITDFSYSPVGDGDNKCKSGSLSKGYKIHLKPCMKISKGTGYLENPFELDDSKC